MRSLGRPVAMSVLMLLAACSSEQAAKRDATGSKASVLEAGPAAEAQPGTDTGSAKAANGTSAGSGPQTSAGKTGPSGAATDPTAVSRTVLDKNVGPNAYGSARYEMVEPSDVASWFKQPLLTPEDSGKVATLFIDKGGKAPAGRPAPENAAVVSILAAPNSAVLSMTRIDVVGSSGVELVEVIANAPYQSMIPTTPTTVRGRPATKAVVAMTLDKPDPKACLVHWSETGEAAKLLNFTAWLPPQMCDGSAASEYLGAHLK